MSTEHEKLIQILQLFEKNLESNKDELIQEFGDGGNDISDADSAYELFKNIMTERNSQDAKDILDHIELMIGLEVFGEEDSLLSILSYWGTHPDNPEYSKKLYHDTYGPDAPIPFCGFGY